MKHPQCAGLIAMVRPAGFAFNTETANNNYFQQDSQANEQLQEQALQQFDVLVTLLRNNGVEVLILEDSAQPPKPDAIFPNNWFGCNNHTITIFPMYAQNRRAEKRPELIQQIQEKTNITRTKDLSHHELKDTFLEGTGSIVFDHVNRIAYACYSARTNRQLFEEHCSELGYLPIGFNANDVEGRAVYHTNVVMCIGEAFAIVCLDAIADPIDKLKIVHELSSTGHEVLDIDFAQMNAFGGNMLQLQNKDGERLIVMSDTAYRSLSADQTNALEGFGRVLHSNVSVIENASGGSVRCMIAELFC